MQQVESTRPGRSVADYARVGVAGFLMGICEIIPGVSGGTMAFIMGIYEELIGSIRDVTQPEFIKAVTSFNVKRVFELLNWKFLLTLGISMIIAILSLAGFIGRTLETQPALIWSFFCGLVIASIWLVSRRIKTWSPLLIAIFILTAIVIFFTFGGSGVVTPNTWWSLILSGAIAICAFILPGISGSFVLVLLGKYATVLGAVNERDFVTVGLVAAGCAIGIVTFARVVSWLFERYHDIVVAVLSGLMLGSLRVIWPWKADPLCLDKHEICTNVVPAFDGQFAFAIALLVAGVVSILLIERFASSAEH